MNRRITQMKVAAGLAMVGVGVALATESLGSPPTMTEAAELDKLAGQPLDIAPWAYEWRADVAVQKQPEAYFIPRRLDRMDKVYRTACRELPRDQLKSIFYDSTDLMNPLLPKPKGELIAGLLWTGRLTDYKVELRWPKGVPIPSPESVEVRDYPTPFGWFGWTVDRILANPEIAEDGRKWTYKSAPGGRMNSAYNVRVPAATEMVAVFCTEKPGGKPAVPAIGVTSPEVGSWSRMRLEIEWGFQSRKSLQPFDGRIEPSFAMVGEVAPLPGDKGTTITRSGWRSQAGDGARRGVTVEVLYAPQAKLALDSRITIWTKSTGFTFRITDLEKGPIYIPCHDVLIVKAGSGIIAKQFVKDLAAKNLKSVRQMTREHPEAASWDQLMQEVRFWTCPEKPEVAPFPHVQDPVMRVQVPDQKWTDAWRANSAQLQGPHLWGTLAFEVGRVARDMELIGLHPEADRVYELFLGNPGTRSDGDFVDGDGALEVARGMRHDMGYSHEGTHASTGRLLLAMSERYFLTGDKEWFLKNRARLQAAADWIIRQRTQYLKEIPNRNDLLVAGLMPPQMLGDYFLPACDWRWYYAANALDLQGLQRFADVLMELDPETGRKYQAEAEAFRKDIRRVVERDVTLSPVRLGRDGAYHSFIPRMPYARGLTGPELEAPEFPDTDLFCIQNVLAEPFAAYDPNDVRIADTADMLDELGTYAKAAQEKMEQRKTKGLPTDDAWFWTPFLILPKASLNANTYLLQDDVPNFLRFFGNHYATVTGSDGRLWEHSHLGQFTKCETPDNGTAGWFVENFRNMLVTEEGQSLWIARGTPRAWLGQGKRIAVGNAPTYFGAVAYEIVSDADNGRIAATVEIPSRRPPARVLVRFRHPRAAPIKSVMVNGQLWTRFNRDKEVIELMGLTGKVSVAASY